MQLLEIVLTGAVLVLLVVSCTRSKLAKYRKQVILVLAVVIVLHVVFEGFRWQLGFLYLVGVVLLLLTPPLQSGSGFRYVVFIFCLVAISSSVFLAVQMPIVKLPSPQGPYTVGSVRYNLIDSSRLESFTADPYDYRELAIEVWYPAQSVAEPDTTMSLWPELYAGQLDRVSGYFGYLDGIKTHAYSQLPIIDSQPLPVIIFNHALQMFTAQNTLLMEALASEGYIIVSIAHPYESLRVNLEAAGTVMPGFILSMDAFTQGIKWARESSAPIDAARQRCWGIDDRTQRASIMRQAMQGSTLNNLVGRWAADNSFILDELLSPTSPVTLLVNRIDPTRIGIAGMSIGGASAAEVCKLDGRCRAGVNIDGTPFSEVPDLPLTVPFMTIVSDDGLGLHDVLFSSSQTDYFEYHVRNTRHADFTDFPLIWPIMRTAGQLGEVPAERVTFLLNSLVVKFFDHYLKGEKSLPLDAGEFTELEVDFQLLEDKAANNSTSNVYGN